MSFDKINRRTHLYLALTLLPWFFMYGLSSVPLAHKFGGAAWTTRSVRDYVLPPLGTDADLHAIAAKMMQDCGLPVGGRYGAYRDGQGNLEVYISRFVTPTRIRYSPVQRRATVQTRNFAPVQILVEMHGRGGFENAGALDTAWSVIVDLVCIAIVTWVLSGLYMWWRLARLRFWGSVAIGGGLATFAMFMLAL